METECIGGYGETAISYAESNTKTSSHFYEGTAQACRAYQSFLDELDFHVKTTFTYVAKQSKHHEDPNEASKCWNTVAELCDRLLQIVSDIRTNIPQCADKEDFDFLLDYKNEALERVEFLSC